MIREQLMAYGQKLTEDDSLTLDQKSQMFLDEMKRLVPKHPKSDEMDIFLKQHKIRIPIDIMALAIWIQDPGRRALAIVIAFQHIQALATYPGVVKTYVEAVIGTIREAISSFTTMPNVDTTLILMLLGIKLALRTKDPLFFTNVCAKVDKFVKENYPNEYTPSYKGNKG